MPNGTYGGVKGRRKSALFDYQIFCSMRMKSGCAAAVTAIPAMNCPVFHGSPITVAAQLPYFILAAMRYPAHMTRPPAAIAAITGAVSLREVTSP